MGILRRHFADWGDFGGDSGRYSPAGYEIGCRRGDGAGAVGRATGAPIAAPVCPALPVALPGVR